MLFECCAGAFVWQSWASSVLVQQQMQGVDKKSVRVKPIRTVSLTLSLCDREGFYCYFRSYAWARTAPDAYQISQDAILKSLHLLLPALLLPVFPNVVTLPLLHYLLRQCLRAGKCSLSPFLDCNLLDESM